MGTNRPRSADSDAWILATAGEATAYAASLLRDRAAAEDVVQDCYCRLLEKAAVYDLPRDGRRLLFASITNACINRVTRARPVLSLEAGESGTALRIVTADDRAEPPDAAAMRRELERALEAELARLPAAQRAALEMKSLGFSQKEIAEALKIQSGHAGVLIHRARRALGDRLAPYLGERAG